MRSALTPDNDRQHRTELFNIGGRRITELVVGVGETPQLAGGWWSWHLNIDGIQSLHFPFLWFAASPQQVVLAKSIKDRLVQRKNPS